MLTIGLKVPLYSGDMSSFCLGCCPPLIRGLPSFGGIIPLFMWAIDPLYFGESAFFSLLDHILHFNFLLQC